MSKNLLKLPARLASIGAMLASLGCTVVGPVPTQEMASTLSYRTSTYIDLLSLPNPRGKIVASVYSFRDQTGQYKPAPQSSFSSAVTQGATALLTEAMKDSGWFIPLEREGLQNLLTERKIIRAAQNKPDVPQNNANGLPSLLAANILLEGGIIAYDTNKVTGGAGARYLGVGASEQYRTDQVTVNLRAVDVRTGQILNNVSTTKTVLSKELTTGVFRFVSFRELLEAEAGYTNNEPREVAVRSAIEAALIHVIVDGLEAGHWNLQNPEEMQLPIMRQYMGAEPVIVGAEPKVLKVAPTAS